MYLLLSSFISFVELGVQELAILRDTGEKSVPVKETAYGEPWQVLGREEAYLTKESSGE